MLILFVLLHICVSGAGVGIYAYLQYGNAWATMSDSTRAQVVGVIASTWTLLQGPSFVQLSAQHYSDGHSHCVQSLFYYLLWAGEVCFIVLAVFVGIGGNWNALSAIYASGVALPIATVTLFAILLGICVFQLIYFMCCKHE